MLASTFSAIWYFSFGIPHDIYQGTTVAEIPFILKLLNPDLFNNDFYTTFAIVSPKIIFAYLVYILTFFGWGWEQAMYFIMVLRILIERPILFLTLSKIYETYYPRENNLLVLTFVYAFIVISMHLVFFQQMAKPSGWATINTIGILTQSTLSYTLGIIYMYFSFSNGKFRYFSCLILLLCTLIHPTISPFMFVFSCIFYLPVLHDKQSLIHLSRNLFIGIVLPLIAYRLLLPNAGMSAKDYIYYYIILVHPVHYLSSKLMNGSTITWTIMFFLPIIPALLLKNTRLIIVCVMCTITYLCSIWIHYMGTEVLQIKLIAQLGLNRFTCLRYIIWITQIILVAGAFISKNKTMLTYPTKIKTSTNTNYLKIIYMITILIMAVILSNMTFKSHQPKQKNAKKLINWITKNTSKEDVLFLFDAPIHHEYIRTHFYRAVFNPSRFPFNEAAFPEFAERRYWVRKQIRYIYRDVTSPDDKRLPDALYCLSKHYRIDYVVTKQQATKFFADYKPVLIEDSYAIYKVTDFTNHEADCLIFDKNIKHSSRLGMKE